MPSGIQAHERGLRRFASWSQLAEYTLSPAVEQALRVVERHIFVPDATLEEAYENDIVVTKRGADDQVLSCLSQPLIVALQLGQMEVQPGHRVLEIGAGGSCAPKLMVYSRPTFSMSTP